MGKYGKNNLPEFMLKKLSKSKETEEIESSSEDAEIETTGHVHESFRNFVRSQEVNEEDLILQPPTEMTQPCEDCPDYTDNLSERAKTAIKRVCETVLIQEAHLCESSEDPNQTYESFLRECTHYLAECLIRASQNLKV